MPPRSALMNAFIPSSSMDDPARFSGRNQEVKYLADALITEGSVPLIYGHRGLGKSSLAVQLSRIAQGDTTLLGELEEEDRALPEEDRFITLYVTCEDSTKNLNGLLKLMINAIRKIKHQKDTDRSTGEFKLVDKKTTKALSLKLFKAKTVNSYEQSVKELDTSSMSRSEALVTLAENMTDMYEQPVLFIIDEIDRLNGVKGLSSFLKSNSSPILKFALVGISTTESGLLEDHKSLSRQLHPVKVEPMNKIELESIVDQTTTYLSDVGFGYRFSETATTELSRLAAGFPWFVHVIGQRALINANEAKIEEISKREINSAVSELATRQMAQTYFDLYQKAVRDSAPRERVLRLFAMWSEESIPTSEMYPLATNLGVGAPANYVGHLTQEHCGKVLARAPQQPRALYYFPDEMFKVYVRIRPSIYEGVKEQVNHSFKNR